MSKQKVDTTSQGCFLGHKPAPFGFPGHIQPSWPLAHRQEQSLPGGGGCRESDQSSRGRSG